MAGSAKARSIDEYIAGFPQATRRALAEIRSVIRDAAPMASEKISYGIPTYYFRGNLLHFAGYRSHIGFYPTPSAIAKFSEELAPYKCAKGSVQFPLGEALPTDLIRRMVECRVAENSEPGGYDH